MLVFVSVNFGDTTVATKMGYEPMRAKPNGLARRNLRIYYNGLRLQFS